MIKKSVWVWLLAGSIFVQAETVGASMLINGGLNALLVDKKMFYVSVSDEVTGGCMPKPKQLKTEMEKSLRGNGFTIAEKNSPLTPEVHLSALGFRINGMCVVDLTVNMYFPIKVEVPHAQNVPSGNLTYTGYDYSIGRHIFNYRRSQMQKKLNKTVRYYGDKIYMSISKAKDDIFKKFPEMEAAIKAQ